VPGGNYYGIGSQAAGIQRQRVVAIEGMEVDGHGAIVSPQQANRELGPSQLSNPVNLPGHSTRDL
jgi:hypothetical protein